MGSIFSVLPGKLLPKLRSNRFPPMLIYVYGPCWVNFGKTHLDYFAYFLVVLGFELRALAKQVFYHLSHSGKPFGVCYFWDRVSLCVQTSWNTILLFVCHCVARMTWIYHYAPIGGEGGVMNFLPNLDSSHNPLSLCLGYS
jgi:hypothetical protein